MARSAPESAQESARMPTEAASPASAQQPASKPPNCGDPTFTMRGAASCFNAENPQTPAPTPEMQREWDRIIGMVYEDAAAAHPAETSRPPAAQPEKAPPQASEIKVLAQSDIRCDPEPHARLKTTWLQERLYRWNYLATGRSPDGWVPKKSLCRDFKRNRWTNHPNNDLCWSPESLVADHCWQVTPKPK